MVRPRKRKARGSPGDGNPSMPSNHGQRGSVSRSRHAVLDQLYPQVLSLREFVLARLPSSSRIRRRKISAIGGQNSQSSPLSNVEKSLAALLDETHVGTTAVHQEPHPDRWKEWLNYSQRPDESYVTLSDGIASSIFSQSEIVDFAIWSLFSKKKHSGQRPKHLLCDGFRQNRTSLQGPGASRPIPGIFSVIPNPNVETLKQSPWPELLALLGQSGEAIMIDLLLDCAIFVPVKAGKDNFCQISGKPVSEFENDLVEETHDAGHIEPRRTPSDLVFVRNRMLYARASLNARGLVRCGLRHIHVLNRSPRRYDEEEEFGVVNKDNLSNTLRVMMYMFPLQFGLHNVFTSTINRRETSQRLKDYTLREEEIASKFGQGPYCDHKNRIPKRLRGRGMELVTRLQISHQRCSYSKMLQHYCPISEAIDERSMTPAYATASRRNSRKSASQRNKPQKQPHEHAEPRAKWDSGSSLLDLATSSRKVSTFCQAVLKRIVPDGFWGSGMTAEHNRDVFLKWVHQFVSMRRFESISLHEVQQNMKIAEIDWLAPPKLRGQKTSQTDMRKRIELFHEFLYFLFDSLLIPLIRSHFYVTESSAHKYRIFFFRHDVWRYVAEPAMARLKLNMFEEVQVDDARRILDGRSLGFSQVRLLPKETGIRPIMNLRRRRVISKGKRNELGPAINKILAPAQAVLRLEKNLRPERLGASMFSVGEIYNRLKPLKRHLESLPSHPQKLYFVKVDVQAAFDTIPQAAVIGLLDSIPQQRHYLLSKHVEVMPNVTSGSGAAGQSSKKKPTRRFPQEALPGRAGDYTSNQDFLDFLQAERAASRRSTVFVDSFASRKPYDTGEMLQLVATHIQQNLVKIGKKFYRQREGIPQGSVLSSILCNYFYADLERHVLGFLSSNTEPQDSQLLRLIDDFLLITTDRAKAVRFVETMHRGVPEYGVRVNPRKTLVNFDLDGQQQQKQQQVARVKPGEDFPYCGMLINCETLAMVKSREQQQQKAKKEDTTTVFDALTVEFSRNPGQTFQRKVLNAFKIQSHLMYFDTTHNPASTALANIRSAFAETATKMWAYARCLPRRKRPSGSLIIRTISSLADLAHVLLTSTARKLRHPGYACDVDKVEVRWLAYTAFHEVLSRKQSGYSDVLGWLAAQAAESSSRSVGGSTNIALKKRKRREQRLPMRMKGD